MKARILQIAAFAIGVGIVVMVIWLMTNRTKTGTEAVVKGSEAPSEPGKENPGEMTEPYRPNPKSSVPGVAQDAKN